MSFERFTPSAPDWSIVERPTSVAAAVELHSEEDAPKSAEAFDNDVFGKIEALAHRPRPHSFTEAQWHVALKDMQAFAREWLSDALAMGWAMNELFGFPMGAARWDARCGLALMLGGRPISAMDERSALVVNRIGPASTFYRHAPGSSEPFDRSGLVVIWERWA